MEYAMMKVYIKPNAPVAKIASVALRVQKCAIVFRNTIYLHQISLSELMSNRSLLCHELVHVMQWKQHGTLRFPLMYLWYSIRHGYYFNPFEVEARKRELDYSLLEKVIFA